MNVRGLWARPFDGARSWRYHGVVAFTDKTVFTLCGMMFARPWWTKVRIPKHACKHCLNKLKRDPSLEADLTATRLKLESEP